MMKNIKVDNHQFISRLIYANNALFLQKWDAPDYYLKHVSKNYRSEFPNLVSYNRFVELI